MAYAPDEITLNDYPKSYNENIKEQKNKSLKKLKKKLLKFFYIFIIIGLLPTLLILKN